MPNDQHTGLRRIRERVQDKIVDWAVLAGLGLLVAMVFTPARDFAVDLFAVPSRLTELIERYDSRTRVVDEALITIRDDIAALRRPSEIFDVARSSGPTAGVCVIGEPCEIRIVARRTAMGKRCTIVPGATTYAFLTADLLQTFGATRTDNRAPQNIGTDWTDIALTVRVPSLLRPGINFFLIVPVYTQCNGPGDTARVAQESTLIEVPTVIAEP